MDDLSNLVMKVAALNAIELTENQISCLEIGMEEGLRLTDETVQDLDAIIEDLKAENILLKSIIA
jgi:hypothetical protein